jgi:hypothetical protein
VYLLLSPTYTVEIQPGAPALSPASIPQWAGITVLKVFFSGKETSPLAWVEHLSANLTKVTNSYSKNAYKKI